MLTERDVDWMRNNRKEITRNRMFPIVLLGETKTGEHPITKEPITEPFEEPTHALVTEVDSSFKLDIDLVAGVEVEKGDLRVDIDLDDFSVSYRDIEEIEYNDDRYTVLAADRAGIGQINRIIIVARLNS